MMPKPQAPRVVAVEAENLRQMLRIQAEIDSLAELKTRMIIGEAECVGQVKQRQQAQLLLLRANHHGPTGPDLAPGEKGVLLKKIGERINEATESEVPLLKKIAAMIDAKAG